MTAKERLDAALRAAEALRAAGDVAGARAALAVLAADEALGALAPVTALGINRRLHAAMLRLAKSSGDPVAKVGLQAHLVPPPDVLARFAVGDRRSAAHGAPVPRVIHQVWIGPRAVPPTIAAWTAHAHAQGYGHRLWREGDLAAAGIDADPVYRARLDRGDYPGAVDAARYAILAREGGVYLDADWYPARHDIGFHDLMPLTGLCAMPEDVPRLTGVGSMMLANSFIAAPPGHPALVRLAAILPEVEAALPGAPAWWTTGPLIFTLVARAGPVTIAPQGFVVDGMPAGAGLAEVQARTARAQAQDQGLLIPWKPW
jgi:inositol phosphorylceramide mannosyltransferase catalytic subunit